MRQSIAIFLLTILQIGFTQNSLRKELDKIITFDSDVSYDLTPGFIIGIIDGDSTYFESFGHHADDKKNIISPNDIFELGSVSKTITSSLVFHLIENKKLRLDQKINTFVPVDYQNPRMKNLAISDLLNHTYYFPKRPNGFGLYDDEYQDPYRNFSKKELLTFFRNYVPESRSGFNYSHINHALLELVIENAMKKPFEDVLLDYLNMELDVNSTFINLGERKFGVISAGKDRSLEIVEPWTFPSFAASEGMKSTTHDLLKYLSLHLKSSFLNKSMLNLNIPTFNNRLTYSNGWHIMKMTKNYKAFISTGNTSGHSAFIGMIPETNTGVVILSNSPYGTKDLGLLILRMINYNWKRKV
jgi:CubicO group peptidase (beta-lactamase class C family)